MRARDVRAGDLLVDPCCGVVFRVAAVETVDGRARIRYEAGAGTLGYECDAERVMLGKRPKGKARNEEITGDYEQ